LDDKTKLVARLASTEWFSIIGYDNLTFNGISNDTLTQVVDRMEKYSWPTGLTFKNQILFTKMDLLRLTNLTKLFTDDLGIDWILFTKLTNLEQIDIHCRNLNYFVLYNHLSNITQVDLDPKTLPAVSSLKKLQSLTFSTMSEETDIHLLDHLACPGELTFLHFSATANVVLNHDVVTRLTQLKKLLWHSETAMQIFPHSLVPSLEKIRNLRTPSDRIDLNINLTSLHFSSPEYADQLVHCTKLKYLRLEYYRGKNVPQSFEYLTALQHLENLSISGSKPGPIDILEYIVTTNLKSFSVSNITFSKRISRLTTLQMLWCTEGSEMAWLSCLTNLTHYSTYNCFDEENYVSYFTQLEHLEICSKTRNFIMDLSNSVNLNYLGLESNISGNCITGMQNLTKLEALYLGIIPQGTVLDANFISHLKNLTRIDLLYQPVRGLWDAIATLPRFKYLSIEIIYGKQWIKFSKSANGFKPSCDLTEDLKQILSIIQ
jgi:hypothetical protein